ncbi:hypothetical protein MHY86_09820 [Aerococcus urinaeequi]|uniref:hypothetical protein n=1 Tax=Aerococcus urinaeequi TaxID=51665 RepID=UPI002280113C|nr:hypothetical protein [Aerococcus urinaeequi]MCY7731980.1 hypothetical protein [Aerococcus urinaeequi]
MNRKINIFLIVFLLLIIIAALVVGIFDLIRYQSWIVNSLYIFGGLVIVINFGRAILLLKKFIDKDKRLFLILVPLIPLVFFLIFKNLTFLVLAGTVTGPVISNFKNK